MISRVWNPRRLTAVSILIGAGVASAASPQSALIDQYCVACHNEKLKTAGVSLQGLDNAKVGENAAVWEKVLRKVHAGQMPPAGLPHPPAAASAEFTNWLQTELDQAALANPNPGHPTIHRLNRAEYSNAIRDLLALDIKPGAKLPADDTGYGFDNIGDVLSLSPMLIERYMSVARLVSRLAVGDPGIKPESNEFVPQKTKGTKTERVSDDLPFDSAGGIAIDYHFPADAEYVISLKVPSLGPLKSDGGRPDPDTLELRVPVKAGTRTVGVTFLAENGIPETLSNAGRRGAAAAPPTVPTTTAKLDLRLDGQRLKLYDVPQPGPVPSFTSMTIAGPYNVQSAGDTPSRRKIFVCRPTTAKDEEPCARKILTSLGTRAYRRPFTRTDLEPLLAFYRAGIREGGFETGIQKALRAMLVSPDFLFRIERDPASTVHAVSDYELASRLSFFLWSSIPDDQLLDLAHQGKLHEPAILSKQVDRMLDDQRAKSFASNFAGQWLYLRNLTEVKPDQDVFPQFDTSLAHSFERETELFFEAIVRENRPVTDLLGADFTYLNQRLAEHYGIPNIYGSQFRRVSLTDPNRGGLLGQGSILTVTSYPNRTSVVQRGKWVLENLLGAAPPPPPADIPALEAHAKGGRQLTMRQQMEQHRANPTCAGCHSRMDPIGFSLENYDGIGTWRAKDAGNVIDATGKLPDGTTFKGPAGLKNLLLTGHRDEFIETLTEKLLTYALGRGLEFYDMPAVRAIIRNAEAQRPNLPSPTIPALIHSIVQSPQFQMRRPRES